MIHIGSTPTPPEAEPSADLVRRMGETRPGQVRDPAGVDSADEAGGESVFVSPPPMPWPRVFPPI